MRKIVFLFLLFLLSARCLAQENYTIEFVNVDRFLTNMAKKCIQENTPSDNRQYAFTLTQNNAALEVKCKMSPDEIEVVEQTDDAWSEMEPTIVKAIRNTRQSHVSSQTPSYENVITQMDNEQPDIESQLRDKIENEVYETVQQSMQQQPIYNNPQVNTYGGNMGYMQVQSYIEADVRKGIAKVGGKICFGDGSCGVIYFLDGMGHGLAVSLDQTTAKWQNANKTRNCQDIYMLPNEKNISTYCNIGLGAQQTQMIINQLGWGQAPAAEWCTRHGNGWYLPSAGELWNLIAIANYNMNPDSGKKRDNNSGGEDGFISRMLQAAGGQPITNDWYWCSSEAEEGQEEAYNISASGRTSSEEKTYELQVRAVRSF